MQNYKPELLEIKLTKSYTIYNNIINITLNKTVNIKFRVIFIE